MAVTVLDRPLYSCAEAARLLQVPTQTLKRWLDGATREGVVYPPVIRIDPGDRDAVTWGEFVEAGLLREYRNKRFPLQKMRPFIAEARERFGVPYPLAHFKPMIDNQRLVYELQKETGLDPELYLVNSEDGQMLWAPPVNAFLERVEFDPAGVISSLHPLGLKSPVAIDPAISFGVPQIRGVRTELVAESVAAGESEDEAARSWGLGAADVRAALSWERSLAVAA
jgi:uncharacterized protein (DUF433 family)